MKTKTEKSGCYLVTLVFVFQGCDCGWCYPIVPVMGKRRHQKSVLVQDWMHDQKMNAQQLYGACCDRYHSPAKNANGLVRRCRWQLPH